MKRLHEVIDVPCNISEAFRFTSDFSRIEEWDPGVVASEKLTPGPVREGSQFKVVIKAGLGTSEMHYTILQYEPPHRVVLEGTGETVHALDDIPAVDITQFKSESAVFRL